MSPKHIQKQKQKKQQNLQINQILDIQITVMTKQRLNRLKKYMITVTCSYSIEA
jgi:hypothetical protein